MIASRWRSRWSDRCLTFVEPAEDHPRPPTRNGRTERPKLGEGIEQRRDSRGRNCCWGLRVGLHGLGRSTDVLGVVLVQQLLLTLHLRELEEDERRAEEHGDDPGQVG